MTDYTTLANAVRTTFLADSWLGNSANVKTIESHKRGFSFQDEKDARFFAPADTPAIAIVPNSAPKRQNLETTSEIRETILCEVVAVSRGRDFQGGISAHQTILSNIERVLDQQKSSTADLGIGAFVQSVQSVEEQVKKGEYYYFISTTTARIEITATF